MLQHFHFKEMYSIIPRHRFTNYKYQPHDGTRGGTFRAWLTWVSPPKNKWIIKHPTWTATAWSGPCCCLALMCQQSHRIPLHTDSPWKPHLHQQTVIRTEQQLQGGAWGSKMVRILLKEGMCHEHRTLTEAGRQADAVAPVETSSCSGHVRSHHHSFIELVVWLGTNNKVTCRIFS